jgi:hypothetical protein
MLLSSMIVHDFDIQSVALLPAKTHSPLPVDPDAVPSLTVPVQGLQPVGGRNTQRIQLHCRVKHPELPHGKPLNVMRQGAGEFAPENALSLLAPERLDHDDKLAKRTNNVKRYYPPPSYPAIKHSGHVLNPM